MEVHLSMRAAPAVIGSALLVAALAVWALWDRPGCDGPERSNPEGSAHQTLGPPLLGGGLASRAVSERSPIERPLRWLLHGRLVGPDPGQVVSAKVSVSDLAVTPLADGTFEIDLTAPLSADPRPEELVATAEHPDFLRARVGIPVPERGDTDPAILECVLPMRPATTLWVRVVDDTGNPIAAARIGSFPMKDDVPDPWPCEEAKTDAMGRARLRFPAEVPTLVLATSDGRMPAFVIVNGAAAEEPTLRLTRGSAIEGFVREEGRPVAGAVLTADVSSGRQQMHLGETETYWDPGAIAPAEATATTDADGRYRMEGLPGWPYWVRLERLADGRKPIGYARSEHPPVSDVDFDLAFGHVVLTATCEGAPVPGVDIWIFAAGGGYHVETDARGEAQGDLAADQEYSAQVQREGYREARIEFHAPAVGARSAVAIPLEAVPPHADITVVLRDPQGKPIPTAGLAFFPAEGAEERPSQVRFGADREGHFRISDVEAGRYRLVVRPGRHWDPDFTWDSEEATWLDETTTVEVPREGDAEVVVRARPGGRIKIEARDTAGRFLTSTCALLDASGASVPFKIATRFGNGGAYTLGGHRLNASAPGEVVGSLPLGRYRLNLVLDGFIDASVEVNLKAGATQTMRVTMERLHGAGADPSAPRETFGAK